MIPGTGKETARLALALMKLNTTINAGQTQALASLAPTPDNKARALDAKRNLKLAERRELVAAGKLPGSSTLPHTVALAVDLVDDRLWRMLAPSVQRALDDTATGAHELWFREDGEAFVSFEIEEDAVLFRLALDA